MARTMVEELEYWEGEYHYPRGLLRSAATRIRNLEEVLRMDRMLQFFQYSHLPPDLQRISRPFCDMAHEIADTYPQNPERTVTLRKLLEAKDAAVRTHLYQES